jgi:hypothetical protein
MFPVVKVVIEGLDPDAMYHVDLEFVQIGNNRWKYMNGDWVTGGKAEPPPSFSLYAHPEAPNYGRHWTKEEISFSKVKLTNKPSPQKGQVSVKYATKCSCVWKISVCPGTLIPCSQKTRQVLLLSLYLR